MRNLKICFLSVFSIYLLSAFFGSCQPKYAVELNEIDSLIVKNKKAMDYLSVDLMTINERRLEIERHLSVLVRIQTDSSSEDFALNYEKYKGILKVYNKFIQNYDVIFGKIKHNEKQLSSLKNSVLDEKIKGYEFKIALQKETENVNDNLINAETIGHRIFQLEPDYQRLSSYFEPQVENLLKQFPELGQKNDTP